MLYDVVLPAFQNALGRAGISINTIADMQVAKLTSANQFLQYGNGNMAKYVIAKDFANVKLECKRLLEVGCVQGTCDANELEIMATFAYLAEELARREQVTMLASITPAKNLHSSEQFPPDLSSTEQKQEYSVGLMISIFTAARPGVLAPSARPSDKILNGLLQFALTKAGFKDNKYQISSHRPDFGKLAMKSGVTEESAGDSLLVLKREGSELVPNSIGVLGRIWAEFLRYAHAMMAVAMPDGSTYGHEAGFVILEQCYADFASQRPSVAAVASALTEGWRQLIDELVLSSDSFLNICKNMKRTGIWIEAANVSRKREAAGDDEVKKLRSEIAQLKRMKQQRNGIPYVQAVPFQQQQLVDPNAKVGMKKSSKPCFNFFAGKACNRNPCPFRHDGDAPDKNPAKP